MSVAGDINNEKYALAVLDAAKDSVRRHSSRISSGLIIPAKDMP